jgi:hypothetical protein
MVSSSFYFATGREIAVMMAARSFRSPRLSLTPKMLVGTLGTGAGAALAPETVCNSMLVRFRMIVSLELLRGGLDGPQR